MIIHSAALLGAGAIGGYIADKLAGREDVDFCILAEGKRAQQLKAQGLTVNGRHICPAVKTPAEARGTDFIIAARKYYSLRDALPMIAAAADGHTQVMSLLNGVDSEEIIGEVLPMRQVMHAVIRITAQRASDGTLTYDEPGRGMGIFFGEPGGRNETERIQAVREFFTRTGILCRVSDNILRDIWRKYALNVCMYIPQAILGVGIGANADSPDMAALRDGLRGEIIAIAAAQGIDISARDPAIYIKGTGIPYRSRYSTLQDLDAGRPTEIDMLCGTAVRLGRKYGVPTPYNEMAYHCIRVLEQKNAGRFDYD